MRFLSGRVVLAATAILGVVACTAYSDSNGGAAPPYDERGADAGEGTVATGPGGFAGMLCTEDAGVLTPIGPSGCGPNQTVIYQKPRSGSGGSAIATGGGAGGPQTPQASLVAACTDTQCGPGQVAVVTYQSVPGAPFSTDAGPAADAATTLDDGATSVAADGAAAFADADDAASTSVDDASGGGAPDATPLATADASSADGAAIAVAADAAVLGIPCGAVVTCVDAPATCPPGQSPSYAPSGKWHCMPNCDPGNTNVVVITYGGTYGSTTVCANPPPPQACPDGQVWTWDYQDEEWVCAPTCNNGLYDQHSYNGQTVCVPC